LFPFTTSLEKGFFRLSKDAIIYHFILWKHNLRGLVGSPRLISMFTPTPPVISERIDVEYAERMGDRKNIGWGCEVYEANEV